MRLSLMDGPSHIDAVQMSMNVRKALPKIHFDQTLYRKVNTCVFAITGTDLHFA